jgi:hypothetical protein
MENADKKHRYLRQADKVTVSRTATVFFVGIRRHFVRSFTSRIVARDGEAANALAPELASTAFRRAEAWVKYLRSHPAQRQREYEIQMG